MKNIGFSDKLDLSAEANDTVSPFTKAVASFAGSLLVVGIAAGAVKAVEEFTHFQPSVSQIHDQIVNGYPRE